MTATVTRLETRARIRNTLSCDVHGVVGCRRCVMPASFRRYEGQSRESYVPESELLAIDSLSSLKSLSALIWLCVAAFGFIFGFMLGQVIVSATFSAIWG